MNSTDEFLNELYEDYYLQCEAFCKEFDQNNDAFSYLYEDKFYKEYYSNFDFSDGNRDKIIYEYLKEITKVVKYLGNDKFSDDEKLLNYLEYFRIYVMYLPYKDTTDFPYLTHESRFNAALLGQGTCVGQS
ncbi:MAG: hypothetical protein RSE45_01670, partial [Bacilli bacterium]